MSSSIIEIHTSDRGTYKRCRRKFGWGSTLRSNLIKVGPDKPAFFLGTGFHFALEDYWGYRRFDHPALAFAAYFDAQKPEDLPDEAEEALDLAEGMLTYYVEDWLREHPEKFKTLVVNGKPQVEVEVAVDITDLLLESAERYWGKPGVEAVLGWLKGRRVHYVTTYDRVVIDSHDLIQGVDYKTAAQFDELNLQSNPQAGSYDWSLHLFYSPAGYTVDGIIWQQHKKAIPVRPPVVNKGKKNEGLSMNYAQPTTHRLYMQAIRARYGQNNLIPDQYRPMLDFLAGQQDYWGDQFVRREVLRRNQRQREVEQEKIVAEVLEMLDPELPLYPNPTKDCSWDCPFKEPCLAMDDGSDYEFMLQNDFIQVAGYKDDWRTRIQYPDGSSAVLDEPTLVTATL